VHLGRLYSTMEDKSERLVISRKTRKTTEEVPQQSAGEKKKNASDEAFQKPKTGIKKKRSNPVISPFPLHPVTADQHKYAKLVSWNVCSLKAIVEKGSLQHYIRQEQPDILCLQETRLTDEKIPMFKGSVFHEADVYPHEFHNCSTASKGYSGVTFYSKFKPIRVHYGIGVEEHDNEGRMITLEFERFYLVGSYIPNSGDGLRRLEYRQRWNIDVEAYLLTLAQSGLKAGIDVQHDSDWGDRNHRILEENQRKGKPVIWCGDLNVAHQEIDLHDPASNHESAGFTDQERDDFTRVIKAMEFVDSFRHENPTQRAYSFWSYRGGAPCYHPSAFELTRG